MFKEVRKNKKSYNYHIPITYILHQSQSLQNCKTHATHPSQNSLRLQLAQNSFHQKKGIRRKTGQTFTIPLLPGAIEILEKYNYQLPLISNVKYNEYIKEAAKEAQVNKAISTHWARHTGATLLLNNGVDMQIVSKVCGHSSIKMTEQIYAKLLDETVVDAISGLNKY